MSFFAALTEARGPSVAVELGADRVSAASLDIRGGRPVVSAHASEPLPPGALVPSLTALNLVDRGAVAEVLGRVLGRVGRPRRIGLIVPDIVAKVSLVRFEQVPARAADLEQLVRWQVKKTAPFPVEDAQVAFVPGVHAADGQEFIVSLARRDIIAEYEAVCADLGAHAGIVDIATFNVINAVLAGSRPPDGDWLLVNMAADSASLAILRGPHVIFFRSRAADTEGTLADLVHQTAMYYEDRLKGRGFGRVILAGAGAGQTGEAGELRRSLEERLATTVYPVDPRAAAALTDRIEAAPSLLDSLAPLVGLLLRHREVAA
jgi:type IV pilus assembly protein PilM